MRKRPPAPWPTGAAPKRGTCSLDSAVIARWGACFSQQPPRRRPRSRTYQEPRSRRGFPQNPRRRHHVTRAANERPRRAQGAKLSALSRHVPRWGPRPRPRRRRPERAAASRIPSAKQPAAPPAAPESGAPGAAASGPFAVLSGCLWSATPPLQAPGLGRTGVGAEPGPEGTQASLAAARLPVCLLWPLPQLEGHGKVPRTPGSWEETPHWGEHGHGPLFQSYRPVGCQLGAAPLLLLLLLFVACLGGTAMLRGHSRRARGTLWNVGGRRTWVGGPRGITPFPLSHGSGTS